MDAPVLLLMDYQEAICRPDGLFGAGGSGHEVVRRDVLAKAAHVLEAFRSRGWPVIHAKLEADEHGHRLTSASPAFAMVRDNGLMRTGDPGTDICHEVAPLPGERVIQKCAFGPFAGTNLEPYLHTLGPTEIVMGGVSTNHVVESAMRYATDAGFPVVVLEDLCAGNSDDAHRFAVEQIFPHLCTVMSSTAYLAR